MGARHLLLLFLAFTIRNYGQDSLNPSRNIKLLSRIHPNKDSALKLGKYSGCWGWYQAEKNREYALIGGTNGTYFADITDPKHPVICDYVHSKYNCIWREIKTYLNYCYVVTDCSNGLQVIDLSYLPDSVHVINHSPDYLLAAHTIFIDNDKLYAAALKISPGSGAGIGVFSLERPERPAFLRSANMDYPSIYAHDVYVRNDTVYASCMNSGLQVLQYEPGENRFYLLGSYTNYPLAGYNHSSFLTENGKFLIFCDEIPAGCPIHLVNVENLENIQPVNTFLPYPLTTPHNPYVVGNDWAIVSCYQDGLHIYDISDPTKVTHVGFFDTYSKGGFLQGEYNPAYTGNWGAYPFLPSKNLIAVDMEEGAYILDASEAMKKGTLAKADSVKLSDRCLEAFTIPASRQLHIKAKAQPDAILSIISPEGKLFYTSSFSNGRIESINTETLTNGFYLLTVDGKECKETKKILITHIGN